MTSEVQMENVFLQLLQMVRACSCRTPNATFSKHIGLQLMFLLYISYWLTETVLTNFQLKGKACYFPALA